MSAQLRALISSLAITRLWFGFVVIDHFLAVNFPSRHWSWNFEYRRSSQMCDAIHDENAFELAPLWWPQRIRDSTNFHFKYVLVMSSL